MKIDLSLQIKKEWLEKLQRLVAYFSPEGWVLVLSVFLAGLSTIYYFAQGELVAYADAESHLNIAKRVVDGLTSGLAHLGGVWLPLPHLLLMPFVKFDALWRTGLAGAIVSGIAFVVSALYIYKLALLITKKPTASFIAAMVFITNPNILYLQATPMTELTLMVFFILSSYFFVKFLFDRSDVSSLTISAFFGFCAALSRYDGWALVLMQAGILVLFLFPYVFDFSAIKKMWQEKSWKFNKFIRRKNTYIIGFAGFDGKVILFCTLSFFAILLWLVWCYLILGDPLYFMHSGFSANSQQQTWLVKGELPAYHNIGMAVLYYMVTSMSNGGVVIFFMAMLGLYVYLSRSNRAKWYIALLLAVPLFFHVGTLYLGQSVIFIPHLTPPEFDSTLFNARYGALMVPFFALLVCILFNRAKMQGKILIVGLLFFQLLLYGVGYSRVISYQDGVEGLSSQAMKTPDAQYYLENEYHGGLVLIDDYARRISIVRTKIPMQNIIYVGNRGYWEESMVHPEKYASLIVMQEGDDIWKELHENPVVWQRVLEFFDTVYKSQGVSIFKRKAGAPPTVALASEAHPLSAFSFSNFFPASKKVEPLWPIECVDTMKYSRDKAREWAKRTKLQTYIDYDIKMVKESGANCIAIDTAYDEEFVPFLKKWVESARAAGLKIWFRGNMSAWEGWFNYKKYTDIKDHHKDIRTFVTKHPDLFEDGDIFTPVHEPENGLPNIWETEARKEAYRQFISDSYDKCVESFNEIGVSVSCNYFSTSGHIGLGVITPELAQKLGFVVVDYYVSDPRQMEKDIQALHERLGVKVVLGEFGAPIPDINGTFTKEEQAQFVKDLLEVFYRNRDIIQGINYWVLSDGSTSLLDTKGDPKPVYSVLQDYFEPIEVHGTVEDKTGKSIEGAVVSLEAFGRTATTSGDGVFSITLPKGTTTLSNFTVKTSEFNTFTREITVPGRDSISIEVTLGVSPVEKPPSKLSKFFDGWWPGLKADFRGEVSYEREK